MIFRKSILLISVFCFAMIYGCSKKNVPSRTTEVSAATVTVIDTTKAAVITTDSVVVAKKAPVKKKPKESIPKVIAVSDNAAKKSVDGRLYYDLQGHRYWRSNKDGKYYLYDKSMNNDPDFKKP
ncbi:MAG: hypothetical protein ABIN67_13280 [Ferruginibacter sp.]